MAKAKKKATRKKASRKKATKKKKTTHIQFDFPFPKDILARKSQQTNRYYEKSSPP